LTSQPNQLESGSRPLQVLQGLSSASLVRSIWGGMYADRGLQP
jgi:hypothetical protein